MFEILQHHSIDEKSLKSKVNRVRVALAQGDFATARAAKIRGATGLYRAALDDKARLIFKFAKFGKKSCILLLELLPNHEYEKSRFLRGFGINDQDFKPIDKIENLNLIDAETETLKYLNPGQPLIHYLDRALSFDDEQTLVLNTPAPLVIIGSAGSGKTVLTLEKMKSLPGDVLFVTHSAHLADSARGLYHSAGFECEDQEVSFLSFKELLETIAVPDSQEAVYQKFRGFFERIKSNYRLKDAHKAFEEIRGVITGSSSESPYLSRDQYLGLGVRQSIYLEGERSSLYDLFERYLLWMKESKLYDPNIIAHQYRQLIRPQYDYAVIDEVQDFTVAQIALIRASIRNPMHFIMSGDANQIVHPNFFSWAKVRSYLYQNAKSEREAIHVLKANYRSAQKVTMVANKILILKNLRYGSVDKESTVLVEPRPEVTGEVTYLKVDQSVLKDLNKKTRRSTKSCIVVLREEDKAVASQIFETPLVFCVHEAKGLEYDTVILFDIVTSAPQEFQAIVSGMDAQDLQSDLTYNRNRDKTDKSAEVYKFFINSLYVAMTRAVQRVYIVERGKRHNIYDVLGLGPDSQSVSMDALESSKEDWQKEARKLELQGRTDQAEQIRREILQTSPVPWKVLTSETYPQFLAESIKTNFPNKKSQHVVFEFSLLHGGLEINQHLIDARYSYAKDLDSSSTFVWNKHYLEALKPQSVIFWDEIKKYGVEHRSPINETPLMRSVRAGSLANTKKLLDLGADVNAVDNLGLTAFQKGLRDCTLPWDLSKYLHKDQGEILTATQPQATRIKIKSRMIKLDPSSMEFFLVNFIASRHCELLLEQIKFTGFPAITSSGLEEVFANLHPRILPDHRKKRAYLNHSLAKNALGSKSPYNRMLFYRIKLGHYLVNPWLEIDLAGQWVPFYDYLGLDRFEHFMHAPLKHWLQKNLNAFKATSERLME